MLHLVNLDKEGRKQVYRLYTTDDFKRTFERRGLNRSVFIRCTGKAPERITKQELDRYTEENYRTADNDAVRAALAAAEDRLASAFPAFKEFSMRLLGLTYETLDEDDFDYLEEKRPEYDVLKLPLSYDNLVRLACGVSERTMDTVKAERKQIDMENTKAQIEELKKERDALNRTIAEMKSAAKKKEAEYLADMKKYLRELERYQAIGTIERITTTLSEVLGRPVKGYSYQDVLDELNTMESRKLAERDYAGVQKVLAAKFAIAQILKGGEANGSE
ncbi:MAG: hypothetical protein IKD69_08315 [Solobacterium sp.]|nr:hypothetical protein [Solobacterium sp.]